ncbi:MAG: DinB family protein [Crocinitomicaceae bacterium]|nr:DinB family protein [Crocinitomicaceae bacterium]
MKRIALSDLKEKLKSMSALSAQDVRDNFSNLSKTQLEWQPNDKSWSIGQCLEHLNAYFRYYLPVFKGKISNSRFREPVDYFNSSPLGVAVYRSVKLGKVKNVKRKLKSPKEYNPLVNEALMTDNAVAEFLEHQLAFDDVIEEATQINLRKTKCPLSLRPVVKLNLGDALVYMSYHIERHIEQAKKVKNLSGFPKA